MILIQLNYSLFACFLKRLGENYSESTNILNSQVFSQTNSQRTLANIGKQKC